MATKLPERDEAPFQKYGKNRCGQAQCESHDVGTTNANYNKQTDSQQEVPESDSEDGEPGGFARSARGQEMRQADQAFQVERRQDPPGGNRESDRSTPGERGYGRERDEKP